MHHAVRALCQGEARATVPGPAGRQQIRQRVLRAQRRQPQQRRQLRQWRQNGRRQWSSTPPPHTQPPLVAADVRQGVQTALPLRLDAQCQLQGGVRAQPEGVRVPERVGGNGRTLRAADQRYRLRLLRHRQYA